MTFRRVDIEQDRLTHRNQGSTESALQQAEDHQLAKVRSDPTQPRCKGEANDRELDEPLTAETPCQPAGERRKDGGSNDVGGQHPGDLLLRCRNARSEEHTSELQSLMRISYAVFCLKKKKKRQKLI